MFEPLFCININFYKYLITLLFTLIKRYNSDMLELQINRQIINGGELLYGLCHRNAEHHQGVPRHQGK